MQSRFEIENDTDFEPLDAEQRLTALRVWATAAPLLIDHSLELGAQTQGAFRDVATKIRTAQNESQAVAALGELEQRLASVATDYATKVRHVAFEIGVALRQCGLQPPTQPRLN